jgi:hypothetical protein
MWVSPVSRRSFKRQREFGVPTAKAQNSFTNPDPRLMKRAGGAFGDCCNAQTALDEAAHISVAAGMVHTRSGAQQRPTVLDWLEASHWATGQAGFGRRGMPQTRLVIALGREGKQRTQPGDAQRYPRTLAIRAKLQTEHSRAAYRRGKWIAELPNGWVIKVLDSRQLSMRGLEKAKAGFELVCLALTLRRMGAIGMA